MHSQSRFLRRSFYSFYLALVLLASGVAAKAQQASAFELYDGDRVVFVGNTFVERAIEYGHIEAALTTRWPDRNITFRNLGWSGDDARGRARRFFGPVDDGFNNLKTLVYDLKPTVVFVAYGAMESYDGQAGIKDFINNMNRLLDAMVATRARIVVVSPVPQENLGPPLPDPGENNRNLKLYAQTLQSLAEVRNHWYINLFEYMDAEMSRTPAPLTDNGIHLNDLGYRRAAQGFLAGMGLANTKKSIMVSARGHLMDVSGTRPIQIQPLGNGLLLTLKDDHIGGESSLNLSIRDLFAGTYTLRLNGRNIGNYSSQQWAAGVELPWTPENDQAGLLLKTIQTKNEFYFYKWRPQNETYLRGFRSHEQGQNAAELEEFDPYIEREEAKIADLKRSHHYTLQIHRAPER
ncbi:MAG: SGNH/GDSL hydrolase family protein [Verrucomicrobia bacterium]|nr:SGNH/GDSL hydrolase family protein [Verrucomicrobiota bacterium]